MARRKQLTLVASVSIGRETRIITPMSIAAFHWRSCGRCRQLPNVQLINLQFGYGSEQLDDCDFADSILQAARSCRQRWRRFHRYRRDSARTWTLVVTTDTAVAHLAGAVGANVTMMLGRVPDWRWLMDGDTTPWYPTMKLVRQKQLGHWDDVVQKVSHQLTVDS